MKLQLFSEKFEAVFEAGRVVDLPTLFKRIEDVIDIYDKHHFDAANEIRWTLATPQRAGNLLLAFYGLKINMQWLLNISDRYKKAAVIDRVEIVRFIEDYCYNRNTTTVSQLDKFVSMMLAADRVVSRATIYVTSMKQIRAINVA